MTSPSSASSDSLQPRSRLFSGLDRMSEWPWWLLVALLLGLIIVFEIFTNQRMTNAFNAVVGYNAREGLLSLLEKGIVITIRTTLAAYSLAVVIGLFVGLARVSSNVIILNIASFYVEVVR